MRDQQEAMSGRSHSRRGEGCAAGLGQDRRRNVFSRRLWGPLGGHEAEVGRGLEPVGGGSRASCVREPGTGLPWGACSGLQASASLPSVGGSTESPGGPVSLPLRSRSRPGLQGSPGPRAPPQAEAVSFHCPLGTGWWDFVLHPLGLLSRVNLAAELPTGPAHPRPATCA